MALLTAFLLPVVATQLRLRVTPKTTVDPAGVRIEAHGPIVVTGNRLVRAFPGAGRTLVIRGSDCRISVLGPAARLTVSGDRNTVNLSGVGSIVVTGRRNRVRWGDEVGGRGPKVTDRGAKNVVTRQ